MDDHGLDPLVRGFIYVLFNLLFYMLLYKLLSIDTWFQRVHPAIYYLFLVIMFFTLLSSLVFRSIILSIVNTLLITYIAVPRIYVNPYNLLQLIIGVLGTLFTLFLINRYIRYSDLLLEAVRASNEASLKPLPSRLIMRNYALLFATLSTSYPLTVAVITTLLSPITGNEHFIYRTLLFFLPVNTAFSMITLSVVDDVYSAIKLGVLSSMGPFSLTSLLGFSALNTIMSGRPSLRGLEEVVSREPGRGVLFGVVKARLVYGEPRRVYSRLSIEISRDRRGKTWYWERYERPLYIEFEKLPNRHIVITGSTGSGKSLFAKHLLVETYMKYRYNFIVFDPHNEYSIIASHVDNVEIVDASSLSLNPLELGRLNPRERAHQLSSIIMTLFRLGHLQRQAIEDLILQTYEQKGIFQDDPGSWSNEPPTLVDTLELCRELMSENELYRRVYPYLRILADNVFGRSTIGLKKLLMNPTIIVLNNLKSDYIRLLYVDTFLQRLLDMMYRREIDREQVIVLDEAYTLFTRDISKNIVSRLMMESRKYGIGLVFITQHPLAIPEPVIENSAIKISFNIAEPRNLDYVAKVFSGTYIHEKINAIKSALRNLKSLNYILTITGINETLLISEKDIATTLLNRGGRIVERGGDRGFRSSRGSSRNT